MRIAILGPTGMMGHAACRVLSEGNDVYGIGRAEWRSELERVTRIPRNRWIEGADALRPDSVGAALAVVRPDVVVNCVGLVKQKDAGNDPILSLELNALFPHRLAVQCRLLSARLVHLSTDCVFSGNKGMYTEEDNPDPTDFYGRSKLLGEVYEANVLTVRTSIIGRQLVGQTGLLEWFLSRRGQSAQGYARAIYSGLTTDALAEVIAQLLSKHPTLSGVWHVASNAITKYDLLEKLNARWNLKVALGRDESFICDRSLDGARFAKATGIQIPSWDEMIAALGAHWKVS